MFLKHLVVLGAALLSAVSVNAQPKGVYQRPDDATGNPDWWAKNHRSPCPALNTLANHGYINRDGKNLNADMLRNAMREVFNTDDSFNNFILEGLPRTFTLADFSTQNIAKIEHEGSLVHADGFYKMNPAQVDGGLANDMLSRTDNNGMIGVNELGQTFRVRLIWCQQKPTGCNFKTNNRDITFREGAHVLMTFGGKRNGNKVNVNDIYSFMVEEKIPDGFRKADNRITLNDLNNLSGQIQRVAGVA